MQTSAAQTAEPRSAAELAADLAAAEARLRRVEAQFRATLEQLPVGVAHSGLDNRFTHFNAKFCAMLGFGPDELTGRSVAELNHPDDLQHSTAAMQPLVRGDVNFLTFEKRYVKKSGAILWARVTVAPSRDPGGVVNGTVGILEDISDRKAAEAELERVHKELLSASRQAGMAEIATNVLHNIGNVLNSLNVSANLLGERIRDSKADTLARGAALLQENSQSLAAFLTDDARGKRLPELFQQLAGHMLTNQRTLLAELDSLNQNIEHIKDIVSTQQTYAKRCGVTETTDVVTLVEDSLSMNRGAFTRHGVSLAREFESVPKITVDKHKVLQILVNLERNAKYACEASGHAQKSVIVRIMRCDRGVQIQVADNGAGISAENMQRLFTHGFTTKPTGHGFGLHSGALAAKELGGSLEAASDGVGRGATFTLTLPLNPPEQSRG